MKKFGFRVFETVFEEIDLIDRSISTGFDFRGVRDRRTASYEAQGCLLSKSVSKSNRALVVNYVKDQFANLGSHDSKDEDEATIFYHLFTSRAAARVYRGVGSSSSVTFVF